jgi:hypothetical protein
VDEGVCRPFAVERIPIPGEYHERVLNPDRGLLYELGLAPSAKVDAILVVHTSFMRDAASGWLPTDLESMNRSDRFPLSKRGEPKQPESAALLPPIVRLIEDVEMFDRLIREGKIGNRSQLARKLGFTRARITQLMGLLKLHPAIKAYVRGLPPGTPTRMVTEKQLRPLTRLDQNEQLHRAAGFLRGFSTTPPSKRAKGTSRKAHHHATIK